MFIIYFNYRRERGAIDNTQLTSTIDFTRQNEQIEALESVRYTKRFSSLRGKHRAGDLSVIYSPAQKVKLSKRAMVEQYGTKRNISSVSGIFVSFDISDPPVPERTGRSLIKESNHEIFTLILVSKEL